MKLKRKPVLSLFGASAAALLIGLSIRAKAQQDGGPPPSPPQPTVVIDQSACDDLPAILTPAPMPANKKNFGIECSDNKVLIGVELAYQHNSGGASDDFAFGAKCCKLKIILPKP
jgi:hypothetical protein